MGAHLILRTLHRCGLNCMHVHICRIRRETPPDSDTYTLLPFPVKPLQLRTWGDGCSSHPQDPAWMRPALHARSHLQDQEGSPTWHSRGMIELCADMLLLSSSVAQLWLILCDTMDCDMPGLPVLYHLPEFAQIHIHAVGDAIQPSDPLLSTFPPDFIRRKHQGLFQRACSSHQVAKVLEFQLQHQSFQ